MKILCNQTTSVTHQIPGVFFCWFLHEKFNSERLSAHKLHKFSAEDKFKGRDKFNDKTFLVPFLSIKSIIYLIHIWLFLKRGQDAILLLSRWFGDSFVQFIAIRIRHSERNRRIRLYAPQEIKFSKRYHVF